MRLLDKEVMFQDPVKLQEEIDHLRRELAQARKDIEVYKMKSAGLFFGHEPDYARDPQTVLLKQYLVSPSMSFINEVSS